MPDDLVRLTEAGPEIEAFTGCPVPPSTYNRLKRLAYSGQFHAVKVRGALAFPRAELRQVCFALGLEPPTDQSAARNAA